MNNLKYYLSPMTPWRAWKEQGLYVATLKAKRLADPGFAELRRRYDHAWLWLWIPPLVLTIAGMIGGVLLETTGIA